MAMDIDRLSRSIGSASTRRGLIGGVAAALAAAPVATMARRATDRPGKGLLDYDECRDRLNTDICRALPFYDRRTCGRAVDRCCKTSQLTVRNAARCVEQGLPRRP